MKKDQEFKLKKRKLSEYKKIKKNKKDRKKDK